MRTEILQSPNFGLLRVTFDAPGEQIVTEAGAMVSMSPGLEMSTNMRGGLMAAAKRKVMGGESLFQNTYTSTFGGQEILLAPAPEGDLQSRVLRDGEVFFLQSGAYMAHSGDVQIDTKFGGVKGFFSGAGLFMLKLTGPGEVFFNSYGALHTIDVADGGYICDTGHIIGFEETLQYTVRKFGGFKGLFFSGEGLICEFTGHGKLYVQTRNVPTLASFLEPFRPEKKSSS
ncbi:TIGR00266 family protein [Myxococcota bacterium]|nr:TIGR00266 family protein [Myxococcota bacterium]MBU1429674.1 TIGR00266 family protein [Myxococcota bacterium]MBU1898135.1 TIGR00266 family protein [Myxococcota bacterium]